MYVHYIYINICNNMHVFACTYVRMWHTVCMYLLSGHDLSLRLKPLVPSSMRQTSGYEASPTGRPQFKISHYQRVLGFGLVGLRLVFRVGRG